MSLFKQESQPSEFAQSVVVISYINSKELFLALRLQTQYVFIHDALNELITCGKTEILAGNLRITTNQLNRHAEGKKISGFQNQYEVSHWSSCIVHLYVNEVSDPLPPPPLPPHTHTLTRSCYDESGSENKSF